MLSKANRDWLEARGVIYPPEATVLKKGWRDNPKMIFDAYPTLTTSQNIGIPAYLANLLDPEWTHVLFAPMKSAEVYGEVKKGDWTTITIQFPMVESTGEVATYGDYDNNGSVGSNYNWVPRQSYHTQTITQYGDRETEMFGLAQVNYVADLNRSSALVLNKFSNKRNFFGIAGMPNYGGLNDPSLPTPISPTTKQGGGTTWAVARADEIYNDILLAYQTLVSQLKGYAIDRNTKLTLAMSPNIEPYLGKVTQYTLAPVRSAIQTEWPNLRIISAPEYSTASGELMQLFVDEIDGEKSAYCAFTEKLRAGRVVPDLSSYKQKKTEGGWGTIIRRPLAFVQMLGM